VIGHVGGSALVIDGVLELPVSELIAARERGLADLL
jgi:hypothetical protein